MKKKNDSLLDWLGINPRPDFSRAKPLGSFLGFLLVAIGAVFFIVAIIAASLLLATILGFGPYSGDVTGAAIRNIGLVVAGMFGLPFIAWRAIVAQRDAIISEQSQITDRLNKAVLGLGTDKQIRRNVPISKLQKEDSFASAVTRLSGGAKTVTTDSFVQMDQTVPNIEVRVGAIMSLERIARDSPRDFESIMGILSSYIRGNASLSTIQKEAKKDKGHRPREDVQVAISVATGAIKRMSPDDHQKHLAYGLDLSGCRLDRVSAFKGNFRGANLSTCSLLEADLAGSDMREITIREFGDFTGANLEEARFHHARLFYVIFGKRTKLRGAIFFKAILMKCEFPPQSMVHCDFQEALLAECDFTLAILDFAKFNGARLNMSSFIGSALFAVDFTGCLNWKQSQFDSAYGVKSGQGLTKLPVGAKYPDHWVEFADLDVSQTDAHEIFHEKFDAWRESE